MPELNSLRRIGARVGRVLGIDLGVKRIGIAISDPTQTIASPLMTLHRRPGKRPPWADLERLLREHEALEAVVGLPLDLSGGDTDWTREVRAFASDLARRTGARVHLVDERMTSVLAERAVRGSGLRKSQREQKERIDETAAALILQNFLDGHRPHPDDATA